jgi:hypothetical protein
MPRMPRPKSPDDLQQVTVMLPADWIARVDVVAANLSEPGARLTRAACLRMIVRRGLEALESTGHAKGRR